MKVYAYVVCVISVIALLIAIGVMVGGVFTIVDPESAIPAHYYLEGKLTEEQQQNFLRLSVKQAVKSLVIQTLIILFSIVLWITHWRLAKKD